jgi:hypothetical protein
MNPQTGRFGVMDTYEGDQEEPLSLHKYEFVRSDGGVNAVDPSGHFSITMSDFMVTAQVISVLSSSYSATRALQRGDYQDAAVNVAFLALDFTGVMQHFWV